MRTGRSFKPGYLLQAVVPRMVYTRRMPLSYSVELRLARLLPLCARRTSC